MGHIVLELLINIIGNKHGCPFSPIHLVLCIDNLEQMVDEFVQ